MEKIHVAVNERKRLFTLIFIMTGISMVVGGIAISVLYRAAIDGTRQRLMETAMSQARLIEAVARYASIHGEQYPEGSEAATLSQITDAHEHYKGFGKTGEFTLARREGDTIVFLLSHRHADLDNPRPIAFDSDLAEPMRRALLGQSGSLVGLDYRGKRVLAAYEPVAELNLGIVAKIDLSEVQAPFVRAALLGLASAILVVIFGSVLFFHISHPMILRLEELYHLAQRELAERKRAERIIGEREEHYRGVFETAVEAIITIDERGGVESFNPAAEKLFGYTSEEVIGQNVILLMPPPYHQKHDQYLADYLRTGEAKIIGIGREVEARRKDGTVFPVQLAVSEVRLGEKRIFTGFIQDLTERKEYERAAERWRDDLERKVAIRTRELTQANQELEHISYVISHDLRTPLRGVRNYVDFLTDDLEGKLEKRPAEDLNHLRRAADELNQMVEELLAYSKIGRNEIEPELIDLPSMIHDIALAVGAEPEKNVVIKGDLPRIHAVHALMRQIFQNLIENALRYNESSPPRIEISAERANGRQPQWVFAFRDNGIGIDPAYHEKIFDIFQRLHSNNRFPGTGIGLAAVRKAIQHLGGSVRLDSQPGQGTVFFVNIPETCGRDMIDDSSG